MIDPDRTELSALHGSNPLAFLAALGTQAALGAQCQPRHLSWTTGTNQHPVLTPCVDEDRLVSSAVSALSDLLASPVFPVETQEKNWRQLKLKPDQLSDYLNRCRAKGADANIAFNLVAQPSYAGTGQSAPTDLYFLAGQQTFSDIARSTIQAVCDEPTKLGRDLFGGWLEGDVGESTLLWDVADDADHALSADDPSKAKSSWYPVHSGAEALAVLGLARFPCFGRLGRTLTQGCSGGWKRGSFTWPLWSEPASERAVEALLAHINPHPQEGAEPHGLYEAWGVTRVSRSQIIRSDQGGYGSFRPPEDVWVLEEAV